jgi:IS30 family transposase
MSYRRLTLKQRYQIQGYLDSGLSGSEIARRLKVAPSTISNEISKSTQVYIAEVAQQVTDERALRRRNGCFKIKNSLRVHVNRKLKSKWSPEQIAGRLKLKNGSTVSHQSIYRYIDRDKHEGGKLFKNLRILRKQRKDRKAISWKPFPDPRKERVHISERPKIVEKRKRLGDWERDLVFGKKNETLLLTMTERVSRMARIELVRAKCSKLVHVATIKGLKHDHIETITNDNGTEFAMHKETSKRLKATCYFARPYRSWERGSNENMNGLLRQYFPRKRSLKKFTTRQIKQVERQLNTRPRKILGFRTPLEVHHRNSPAVLR